MDEAQNLIRTAVRTFYGTRQILVIDALFVHSVLHADDLGVLLSTQPKDVRRLVGSLRSSRIILTHSRNEAKVGSNRPITREYYYIPYHIAIDAIKYRVMKLIKKIEEIYRMDAVRKEWRCPVCKAEWEGMEVLDRVGPEGFECHRCGNTLVPTEKAIEPAGGHEKIRRLNIQLGHLLGLIAKVDQTNIPENNFLDALDRKKEVPRDRTGQVGNQYITLKNQQNARRNAVEYTDAAALNIKLTSSVAQHEEEMHAEEERRKAEAAKANQLPSWHTASLVSTYAGGMRADETPPTNGLPLKKEDSDEKKPDLVVQDDLAAYMAEMKRENEERALKNAEEDAEDEDEEDDFEDVMSIAGVGTPLPGTGTPASSQPASASNGIKRELESDSGISSEANTPAVGESPAKRVKFEHVPSATGSIAVESEDEDEDFEDAL